MSSTHVQPDMSEKTATRSLAPDAHTAAAEAFVERAIAAHGEPVVKLYVFGSTARGDARGVASDVDILVVLDDDCDRDGTADALRDIALDVMIEHGPVVELHILSETAFEEHQRDGNPFIRNVVSEGHLYA